MARFLFINPPLVLEDDFIDYPFFANHGLLACAGLAARSGADVVVHDAFALPDSGRHRRTAGGWVLGVGHGAFAASLPRGRFDVVVLGNPVFLRIESPHPETDALIATLRERFPRSVLLLADGYVGGQHYADYDADRVLARHPELDAVLKYPGERCFADPDRLAGLGDARVVLRDADERGADPLEPFFFLEGIDVRAYDRFLEACFGDGTWQNTFGVGAGTRSFVTSIGCPHRCIFCTSNPGWRRTGRKLYRPIPLARLKDWAYLLRTVFGARKLIVLDEMVNVRTDFEAMLRMLNELDFTYDFPNGMRADHLSREAIALMRGRVGMLSISAESASQEDLHGPIGKGQPLEAIRRVAAWCRELDVPLMSHYIIGFPWETPAHVTATLDMAWDLYDRYRAWPSMQFATPILGTALHEQCVSSGLIPPEGIDLKDGGLFQHRPCFDPPGCPPGYLEKARAAFDMKVAARGARKLIMNITYKCANRCVFCATGDRVSAALGWDKIEEILRQHRAEGTDQLDIDGGEPTTHPRLTDAIALARALGYRSVNLTSNGRLLRDRALAERVVRSGITHLLISLHGTTAEVHEAATDAPGSFADTIAGIDNVMGLRPPYLETGVNVTIVRANLHDLMDLAALAIAKGFAKINFQLTTPFGRAWEDVVPPLEDAAHAVMRVIDRYADQIQIYVVNAQFCAFPGYERWVAADLQKMGRTMVFAADPRFPEQVNLHEWLGAKREKRAVCAACPWTTVCDGFQVFRQDKPDMRVERARPLVASA
ncbi:MAG: radical SAM protein [Deltaproteobacteria bacterium]|nr:radical SAM protein [Deltaproteobacteria bacterium]